MENPGQFRVEINRLAKTCRKPSIGFWDYLGARLGVPGAIAVPQLSDIIRWRSLPA
jgi:hypothetical protein